MPADGRQPAAFVLPDNFAAHRVEGYAVEIMPRPELDFPEVAAQHGRIIPTACLHVATAGPVGPVAAVKGEVLLPEQPPVPGGCFPQEPEQGRRGSVAGCRRKRLCMEAQRAICRRDLPQGSMVVVEDRIKPLLFLCRVAAVIVAGLPAEVYGACRAAPAPEIASCHDVAGRCTAYDLLEDMAVVGVAGRRRRAGLEGEAVARVAELLDDERFAQLPCDFRMAADVFGRFFAGRREVSPDIFLADPPPVVGPDVYVGVVDLRQGVDAPP